MKKLTAISISLIIILLFACEIPDQNPDDSDNPGSASDPGITAPAGQVTPATVYTAGYEDDSSGISTAKYWTGGVETKLPVPDKSPNTFCGAEAYSIFVSGTEIYVAGQISYENAQSTIFDCAAYWKDDGSTIEAFILEDGPANNSESIANDIYISGTDVYVAGYINSGSINNAILWTISNSTITPTTLENKYGQTNYDAEAFAVYVDGTDIYAAGQGKTETGARKAMYWKNGARTIIGPDGLTSCLEDLTADGADVYAAGWVQDQEGSSACQWKNGVLSSLSSRARAYSITLDGSDVYIAGNTGQSDSACYWENATEEMLTDFENFSYGKSIDVEGSHVYVAGYDESGDSGKNVAVYWKCEKAPGTAWVKTALTDGQNMAVASSIFVVK